MIVALLALIMLTVRTLTGRDHQALVMGSNSSNGSGSYASGCWIGLSANATAPDENDTALAGEIATGTLVRAQAIFAHTTGTNFYTLTKSFTSDQIVTINKIGIFNASTAGTMTFESAIDPTPLRAGDQIQITESIVLG